MYLIVSVPFTGLQSIFGPFDGLDVEKFINDNEINWPGCLYETAQLEEK